MTDLRKCIGSVRFGIEAHGAPVDDFPIQPSQKDGLGRMCKPHWNAYTAGLARDAKARKAAAQGATVVDASVRGDDTAGQEDATASASEPTAKQARRRLTPTPVATGEGDPA